MGRTQEGNTRKPYEVSERFYKSQDQIYNYGLDVFGYNIILNSHLIIYRITDERIEVLDIVHSASSIRRIRAIRSIRL